MRSFLLCCCCVAPCLCACIHFVGTNKAIAVLKEFRQLFLLINVILNSTMLEIPSLLQILQSRNICVTFCRTVLDSLCQGDTFLESWKKAFSDNKYSVLTSAEKTELISFAEQFGLGTIEDQHNLCEQFADYCLQCIAEKKESLLKNGKLSITGSVLFGCFLYVIFM